MKISRVSVFILIVLFLVFSGVVFVFDASYAEALRTFGDQYHFARNQVIWVGLGLFAMSISALMPKGFWKNTALIIAGLGVLAMTLVLIPGLGVEVNGAKRWLSIAGIQFQPSELAKLSVAIVGGFLLTRKGGITQFLFYVGVIVGLMLLQPDLDTSLVIVGMCFAMLYSTGTSLRLLISLALVGLVIVPLLIVTSPYRRERLLTFFDSSRDPLGASYHVRQVQFALGSGGMFGKGFGQSRAKYQFIPEASTDSIFAIIAEEVGFIGSTVLILAFTGLVVLGYGFAHKTDSAFDSIVATGLSSWIFIQSLLNLGSMTSLIPLGGITLPYISYGGSSLLSILIASGILIGIGVRSNKEIV